jgi:hypothetical protein
MPAALSCAWEGVQWPQQSTCARHHPALHKGRFVGSTCLYTKPKAAGPASCASQPTAGHTPRSGTSHPQQRSACEAARTPLHAPAPPKSEASQVSHSPQAPRPHTGAGRSANSQACSPHRRAATQASSCVHITRQSQPAVPEATRVPWTKRTQTCRFQVGLSEDLGFSPGMKPAGHATAQCCRPALLTRCTAQTCPSKPTALNLLMGVRCWCAVGGRQPLVLPATATQ